VDGCDFHLKSACDAAKQAIHPNVDAPSCVHMRQSHESFMPALCDSLGFEPVQNERTSSGGIFIGSAWMAMPFFGGKNRTRQKDNERSSAFQNTGSFDVGADDGQLSWTFFLDSANVHGPLLTYPPEFFTRNSRWFNENEGKDTPVSDKYTLVSRA
jgi:hypothetical protein